MGSVAEGVTGTVASRCPRCGCPEAWIVSARRAAGHGVSPRVRCDHCRHEYAYGTRERTRPEEALEDRSVNVRVTLAARGQPRLAVPCPGCHSAQTRVASTRRKADGSVYRRHKCEACGVPFRSDETDDGYVARVE